MRRNTYPGKRKLLFEIKKGKLKTEKLLKIAILDEQEPSRQSADKPRQCKSEAEYVSTKTWKVTVTASIFGNK